MDEPGNAAVGIGNALTDVRMGEWGKSPSGAEYYAWISAKPTQRRRPDEIYGVRIDIPVGEWDGIEDPEKRLIVVGVAIENALETLEMFRLHPPPFEDPFGKVPLKDL